MINQKFSRYVLALITCMIVCTACRKQARDPVKHKDIHVAVASNFADASKALTDEFSLKTGTRFILSFGSTGKHYAQIKNGAPFDIFFAADTSHPLLLESEGSAIGGSRFTYAVGKLVLWSKAEDLLTSGIESLRNPDLSHIAIANPRLAPYGEAAMEVLAKLELAEVVSKKLVNGENIGQTFQFVASGSAEAGFVALSQVKKPGAATTGSYITVPQALYTQLDQQAVLLKDSQQARDFLDFVRSKPGIEIIRGYGYDVPHANE